MKRSSLVVTLALLLSILHLAAERAGAEVVQEGGLATFILDTSTWTDRPRTVNLAGSFNGWSTTETPMSHEGDFVWRVTLELPEGKHLYKFVIDGQRWLHDPTGDAELEEDDGHGGLNSGVIIGPDIRTAPPPRPNHIATEFVLHDPSNDVSVVGEGVLRLRMRAQAGDVQRITVYHKSASEIDGSLGTDTELTRTGTERGFDIFSGIIESDASEIRYFFDLRDGEVGYWVGGGARPGDQRWVYRHTPEQELKTGLGPDHYGYRASVITSFDIPAWARHAVWYQIFPERFRNGDPSNDPGDRWFENLVPWTSNWWDTLPGETPPTADSDNFYTGAGDVWKRRYGGDIQGIQEKLPYLRKLGVTAIYLNPVFLGESMHKYDAGDFRHIDSNFAVKGDLPIEGETDDPATWQWSESDKVFLDFIEEAHRQGFRVIIDGVWNHVGRAHWAFQDVLANGQRSRYADWFEITDWGDPANWREMEDPMEVHGRPGGIQWVAWDGHNGHLPVFRKCPERGLAEGPYEHVMAVTKRWLAPDGDPSRGVDGWRLDVPGDIPHPFWRDWRIVVKETKPDAYIVGEIWQWAQPWLQGDQFDATMNYQFAMPAQAFFVNVERQIPPSEFDQRLRRVIEAYPRPVAFAQQNLFASHDTDRVASMFVNPDRPYDGANRLQDNARHFDGPMYSKRKPTDEEYARMKQMVAFQHAFVGAPMTYYGDEAGMWGPDDPSNRQPFPWPDLGPYDDPEVEFRRSMFEHYQRAIAIRNAVSVLRAGDYRAILLDDERNLFGFERADASGAVYVVLNRSDRPATVEIELMDGLYLDFMDEEAVAIEFGDDGADARPRPVPRDGAEPIEARDGRAGLELGPWQTMILVPRD